jgi:ACS family tartrate transporter-like MFS transporter
MLTWGLISAGMIFVSTPLQFYFMRFLLGVAEAGFFPGVMLYLSYWFPARWSGRATSRFYIALPISTIIMGVLAGALLGLDGAHGLAGWQWLFLIEAIPAVAMAAVLLLVLPDSPDTVAWLTTDEKDWVRRSLAADAANSGVADHSILRAMLDPLVLGIGLAAALAFAAQNAIVYSAPKLLIDATGWSTSHVGFVVAAGGAVTVVVMLLVGASSDHRHERYLHQLSVMAATAVGVAAMALGIAPAVTVLGYFVFIAASTNFGVLNYLMVGDGIHPGARPVGFAALNTIAQVGNFLGPVLWGIAADRTGSFRFGLWSAVVCLLAAMAVVLVMRQRTLRLRFAAA